MNPADAPWYADAIIPALTAIGSVLVALIGLAKMGLGKWLDSKAKAEDASAAEKMALAAGAWVSQVVFDLVLAAEQTVMKEAKAALADGSIDSEEYRRIRRELKNTVLAKAQSLTLGKLTDTFGLSGAEAAEIVDAKVEAAVLSTGAPLDESPQG